MARYSRQSQKTVEQAMEKMKHGKLRSGRSGKKVKNPKQAIAIGLSEARRKGSKVPPRPPAARRRRSSPSRAKKHGSAKS